MEAVSAFMRYSYRCTYS